MKILDVPQSGSLAGTTSSRNRYGQYRRTRANPVNPGTPEQTKTRQWLGFCAAQWRGLTDSQRSGWAQCAAEYPVQDSLGQTSILTGAAMFVRSNTARLRAGLTILLTPAQKTPWSPATAYIAITGPLPYTIAISGPAPTTGQTKIIDASPQLTSGINYWSDYRFMAIQAAATATPVNIETQYVARFGPLITGRKIFIRTRILNECGVYGPEYLAASLVPSAVVLGATSRRSGRTRNPAGPAAPAEATEGSEALPGEDEDQE